MKSLYMIQTFDGQLFTSEKAAEHHLDVLYSNAVSEIAARLTSYSDGKYQKTKEWVDENLSRFVDAKRIKDDMTLIQEDNEN